MTPAHRARLEETADHYAVAMAQASNAKDALVAARVRQVQADPRFRCSNPDYVEKARDADNTAQSALDKARTAFYAAVDASPHLRWRLLNEFTKRKEA